MTQLQPARLKDANYERHMHFVVPEHGTPFEALLDPAYWAHVSAKFKPCDQIEVHAEDGSYYGRLLVRDAGKLYAKVSKLEYVELDKVEVLQAGPMLEGHTVKWRGPVHKWSVVRGVDVLKDGMTKEEAQAYLASYARTAA
jgi:hypothetical protein